jgi:thiamine pyrophosphate-dependent acetolactate synthase large subunit-like protein
VVTGLGSCTYDVASAGDHERNYYLWGAMGSAAMVGLGLALARPKDRVLVVTGDGEMLMGLGALATVGVKKPRNLSIAVFDNGHYGETGMQRSHAGAGCDLVGVARACGIASTHQVESLEQVAALRRSIAESDQTLFARILIEADEPPRVMPSRDAVEVKLRLRGALGVAA